MAGGGRRQTRAEAGPAFLRVAPIWALLCCNVGCALWSWLIVKTYTLFLMQEKRPFQAGMLHAASRDALHT